MSGIQKLHLEDVWDDSPQNRSLINLFEKDAFMLRDYTSALHNCCQRVQNAQTELSAATRDLSDQLKTYQHIPFPLMNDNSVLKATLSQFTVYLDELSSIQQILAGQLTDSMMYPISRFLQADLEEISNMSAAHHAASTDKEQAMTNYMKIQKKLLETDKQRQDADTDVFLARKKYHKTALHYSAALNGLQYKRSFSLIEPILGYIHAQKSFYEMGSEVLMVADVKEFLNNIHSSIQGVQEELSIETQSTVDRISVIEQNTAHLYHIEQQPNIPGPAADLGLAQKAGYLNVRSSKALFSSTWERCYFFTQGGNLMSQGKDEVAGSLTLDLNEPGTKVSVAESENRRFVFQVNSPSVKKVVLLQAESERERDEWMATIGNIICDGDLTAAIQQSVISSSQSTGHLAAQSPTQSSAPSAAITIPPSVRALIRDPTLSRSGPPPTPPPTPAEGGFIPNAPIQFDIITPSEESKPLPGSADGPPRRVNPFDATSQESGDAGVFSEQFEVRFCGSMMVDNDRGSALVQETIRQIMAARALNNVFKMSESKLKVTEQYMQLLEPDTCTLRMDFDLADLSFWSVHPDNARLFAFICRSKGESEGIKTTFTCYVFECNKPAEEISQAISTATKLAFQSLMAKKSQDSQRQKEKEVLLQNIDQLDDRPSEPQFSDDGQYLMLETDEHTSQDDQAEALTTDQSQSESGNPNQSQHEEQATEQQATPPSNLDESEA